MQYRELYRQILGIETPWLVERLELKLAEGEVHVYLEHQEMASWPCPECGARCQFYDHQEERQWRHLATCQYQTILHAQICYGLIENLSPGSRSIAAFSPISHNLSGFCRCCI